MAKSPRKLIEISTTGIDEYLQLVGGDSSNGSTSMGLRVPTLATPSRDQRYLFALATFSVGPSQLARIIGSRQFVSIGQGGVGVSGESGGPRYVEMEVTSSNWRFQDGNVFWGLRRTGAPNSQGQTSSTPSPSPSLRSTAYQTSTSPALLYDTLVPQTSPTLSPYYVDLTSYTPPALGRLGEAIEAGTEFYDLRTPWRTYGAWGSLGFPIEGPDTVTFFASVRQTDPNKRVELALPDTVYAGGLPPEEQFLQNFPNAIYWRVAASLIVEFDDAP
jgi:hypothetical protein